MTSRHANSIAEAIEQAIVTGEFPEGERLDEVRLADRFGVSRTPIREALQRLAASGLVEAVPRRGVFVRQMGPVELIEAFEAMAEYEATCGYLAAKRISIEALKELATANKRCAAALKTEDADTYYRENEQFHHLIYKASGNSYLERTASTLHKRLRPFRRMQLHLRGRMPQSMAEHEAIVAALNEGNPEKAASALRSHVAVQGEKFHHLLASLKAAQ